MNLQDDKATAIAEAIADFCSGVMMPSTADILKVIQQVWANYNPPVTAENPNPLACPSCHTVQPRSAYGGWASGGDPTESEWDEEHFDPIQLGGMLEAGAWNGSSYQIERDVMLRCCSLCGCEFATTPTPHDDFDLT